MSGTVTITVNSSTGAVTALASGGNTGTAGTLTYTWSGGTSGTGTTTTPTLGVPATCTVTASDAAGEISATITVYKVETALVGNVGSDAATITNAYGKIGDVIDIDYVVGTSGSATNSVAFTGGVVVDGGTSPAKYTIVATDATNGIITITATFTHTDVPPITYTISATPLLSFGTLPKPYTPPTGQTVTVTNTGTGAITLIQPTSINFIIGALSTTSLLATGDVATFTVQPKPGLPIGVYNEIITITGNDGASATITANFTVICPSEAEDIDGNIYTVTSLAGLCWIENIKTTKYADGADIPYAKPYYSSLNPNAEVNKEIFGLLYTWYSAVNVPEGSSTLPTPDINGNIQGICPNGWHIPTQAEWEKLYAYDAKDLKSITLWLTPNSNTNLTGFNALPAGMYNAALKRCQELHGFTGYWSCSGLAGNVANYFYLTYYCDLLREDTTHKANGLSVRCVFNDF